MRPSRTAVVPIPVWDGPASNCKGPSDGGCQHGHPPPTPSPSTRPSPRHSTRALRRSTAQPQRLAARHSMPVDQPPDQQHPDGRTGTHQVTLMALDVLRARYSRALQPLVLSSDMNANWRHCGHRGLLRRSTLAARGSRMSECPAQQIEGMGDTHGLTMRPTTGVACPQCGRQG